MNRLPNIARDCVKTVSDGDCGASVRPAQVARLRTLPHAGRRAPRIFDFIEGWYNPRRRHSALDYLSPMIYERARGPAIAQCPQDRRSTPGVLSRYPPRRGCSDDLESSSPSTEPGQLQKRGVRFRNQDFLLG